MWLCSEWKVWTRWLFYALVICTLSVSSTRSQESKGSLKITPEGASLSSPSGTGYVVFCKAEGGEAPYTDFKWIGPTGQQVESRSPTRVATTNSGYALSFDNPTAQQSGQYTCKALYGNTVNLIKSVNITFYHDITFEDCSASQYLILNQEKEVKCTVRGNPLPLVAWTKDGVPVGQRERYEITEKGVTVKSATPADRGTYIVSAMVSATGRFDKRNITVEVYTPPKISDKMPESSEMIEGSLGRLECSAEGYPHPRFYWFDKANRNLSTVNGFQVDPKAGVLLVSSVGREEEGRYRCQAVNPAGTDSREVSVSVIVKPRITEFRNVTVSVGGEVKLECRSHGKPVPDMKIRKDGDPAFISDQYFKILQTQNAQQETVLTMTASSATRHMDGLYYCSAENKAEKVERVGHLAVQFPPDMTASENPVKTWGQNVAELKCIAQAIPNASITWYYRKQPVMQRPQYITVEGNVGNSTLRVYPSFPDRYGTYECWAQNFLGNSSIEIKLEEARLPGVMERPPAGPVSPTAVEFKLRAPADDGGSPITKIVIKYWADGEREDSARFQEWTDVDSTEPVSVDGLEPKHRYWFRFAAENKVGRGSFSEALFRDTPEESAPDAPTILSRDGNSMYPDKYEIRWVLPRDNGRPIQHFRVTYFKVDKRPGDQFVRVGESKTRQVSEWHNVPRIELTGLFPESYYRAEIEAYNDIGYSEKAAYVFRTARGSAPEEEGLRDMMNTGSLGMSLTTIVVIVVVLVLVILLVLDVVCYFRFQWGFLFCLRHSLCSRGGAHGKKEAVVEDGKSSIPAAQEQEKPTVEPGNPRPPNQKELVYAPDKSREAAEDTPMIDSKGLKDGRHNDNFDAEKNLKGSKSSIAKDSMV
ncbi:fasciclin-2-like isoform X2 [Ornithodoros turicata]|uniref:fasciclin-2-like isoform X2 n=1 Tax=Ornithodoros turicata TaxID=34597 RepID=UPI003138B32B